MKTIFAVIATIVLLAGCTSTPSNQATLTYPDVQYSQPFTNAPVK